MRGLPRLKLSGKFFNYDIGYISGRLIRKLTLKMQGFKGPGL